MRMTHARIGLGLWVLTGGEQFRPGPPPSLTSQT
jgi:hypothetical protein